MFKIPIVNHSLKYNPSLDGIRGIAILSVLLFHIYPQYFHYGYLGVDLFFVLSGYLITNIIYRKLENDTFSFKEFYRNRIRRIFPAVIIVLLFTLLIGWLFLFPSELENLGKHIKSSAFFYQNFRLIDEVGYWDKAAQLKPLLHFWSLSVEEQFYVFWPLVIFTIYKLRFNLIYALVFLLIISFSIKYIIDIDTFYHSLARFWELILGGLLFAIGSKYKYELPNNKILSNKYLVFFGLISFPLYLWHYVLISYMYIFGLDVGKYGLVIILSSIILAYLTYRYIEIYTRKQSSYKFVIILFFILLSIGFIGKYIYKHKGLENRSHLVDNSEFNKQFIREPATNNMGVNLVSSILGKKPKNDYIKSTTNDMNAKFIAVIGDSHAHTSYPGFSLEAEKYGYESLLISNSSCPPYLGGGNG
jgi:peptidoglycan/LPS O-acetylase OafA/YrhL